MTTEELHDAAEAFSEDEVEALLTIISTVCEGISMNVVMTALIEMVAFGIRAKDAKGTTEERLAYAKEMLTTMVHSGHHRLEEIPETRH